MCWRLSQKFSQAGVPLACLTVEFWTEPVVQEECMLLDPKNAGRVDQSVHDQVRGDLDLDADEAREFQPDDCFQPEPLSSG